MLKRFALATLCCIGVLEALAEPLDDRLQRADENKRNDFAAFLDDLGWLEQHQGVMSPAQRDHLRYLMGWKATFSGDYEAAIAELQPLGAVAVDPVIAFRSRITLINALTLNQRFVEGYQQLYLLLEQLEIQTDQGARAQALGVASQLYHLAGQHEEAMRLSTQLLAETELPWARCGALALRYDAAVRAGQLTDVSAELDQDIAACSGAGQAVFAGIMRCNQSQLHLSNGRIQAAIASLEPFDAEIDATRYAYLRAERSVRLANAYLALGDQRAALAHAQNAIEATRPETDPEPLAAAWRLVAEIAEQRGDYEQAHAALKRHSGIARAHADEASRRALAYQMALHRTQLQTLQIEGLNQQNQLLRLNQDVASSAASNARLWTLLLLSALIYALIWGWRSRRMRSHYQQLAQSDSLTGAASRPHFMAEASRQLLKAEARGQSACLVIMDLDFFKSVNDEFGHSVGDAVLQRAIQSCLQSVAMDHLFGRLGGEEFAILIINREPQQAMQLAESLRLTVNEVSFGDESNPRRLAASFGVAMSQDHGYQLANLLIAADTALYAAKRQGRNRVVSAGAAND